MNELSLKGIVFVRCSRVNEAIVYDENVFDPHNRFIMIQPENPRVFRPWDEWRLK